MKSNNTYQKNNARKRLRYPKKIIDSTTDYLKINIIEYSPIGKNNNFISSSGGRRNINPSPSEVIKTIILPIPQSIQDANSVKYGDSSLNSIAAAGLSGIIGVMESGESLIGENGLNPSQTIEATKKFFTGVNRAAGGIDGLKGLFTRQLASEAAGLVNISISPDQILARQTGAIMNPNMELLFNGPTLRSFNFSFKMTPRNEDESQEIKLIINSFKQYMAPKIGAIGNTNNETFLRTPNVFELSYKQGNNEHKFLNKFKQCFLENINVNYSPDGVYATYDDGSPVAIELSLSFKEIQPIYDVDYNTDYKGVGY